MTTKTVLALLIFLFTLPVAFCQDPYVVEGLNGNTWEAIERKDDVPDQTVTDWGLIEAGMSVTKTYRVRLIDSSDFEVSRVTTEDRHFVVEFSPGRVAPGEPLQFTLTFTAPDGVATSAIDLQTSLGGDFETYPFAVTGEGEQLPTPPLELAGNQSGITYNPITPGAAATPTNGTQISTIVFEGQNSGSNFRISNPAGSATRTVTAITLAGNSPGFEIVNPAGFPISIQGGSTASFEIHFSHVVDGVYPETVVVAIAGESSLSFAIQAETDIARPEINVRYQPEGSPEEIVQLTHNTPGDPLDFGLVDTRSDSVQFALDIKNTGDLDLEVTSITSSDPVRFAISSAVLGTVEPGPLSPYTTSFVVTFTPVASQLYSATVTIASNDPDYPEFTFTVTGQGEDDVTGPEIEVAATGLYLNLDSGAPISATAGNHLGLVGVGTTSTDSFIISNVGGATLTISGITSDNPGIFAIANQPTSIPSGGSAEFDVIYSPQVAGTQSTATISIASNDTDGGESPFLLYVRGVAADAAPVMRVETNDGLEIPAGAAASSTYRTILAGDQAEVTVMVRNVGTVDLILHTATATGGFSAEVESGLFGEIPPVAPGETARVFLRNSSAGAAQGLIHIVSNDGSNSPYRFEISKLPPAEPQPLFKILSVVRSANDVFLTFESVSGQSYTIEQSPDLNSWTPVSGHVDFVGGAPDTTRLLSGAGAPAAGGKRFFRVVGDFGE